MLDKKFDQYRTEVCPEIEKNCGITFSGYMTEKCRSEEIRGGAFSIGPWLLLLLQLQFVAQDDLNWGVVRIIEKELP